MKQSIYLETSVVGAYLDKNPDWDVIADLVRDAYMATIPKRLKAALELAESPKKRR